MPIKYEMKMLEQPQSTRFAIRGGPTPLPGRPSGAELAGNTNLGALGANLTTGQKKLIAFVAGVAVGMFIKRKK